MNEFLFFNFRFQLVRLILAVFPPYTAIRLRPWLLRLIGFSIGKGSVICNTPRIVGNQNLYNRLVIGKDCLITVDCYFDLAGKIIIHDDVTIGPQTSIITGSHEIAGPLHRCGKLFHKDVEVGKGVWIGARCTILPGVKIGNGAVVAAGAVVARDVAENTLVGGVPAKVIRELYNL